MQDIVSYLQQKRKDPFPSFRSDINTWFLLDRARGEETLPAFFEQHDLIAHIDNVVIGTKHTHLQQVGPLLIKLNHTQISDSIYHAILRERSGIFIQSDADDILAHLQYLFIMNSDRQGLVYARYYDPAFWIGAHFSLPEQYALLWGNMNWVYTLLPTGKSGTVTCMEWQTPVSPAQKTHGIPESPISLSAEFYEMTEDIKLFYFLSALPQDIPEQRLREIIVNLRIFAQAGINSGHLLEKAVDLLLSYPNIALRSDVQEILHKDILAIQKLNEITGLANKD